ncbi:polyprenyl synthetase [Rhodothermaceae bacterium RA]|nr:polyprenyl synthetase [Rhodothermaceae bacterium RA]
MAELPTLSAPPSSTGTVEPARLPRTLDEIRRPVADEMVHFERYYEGAMASRVPLLTRIAGYLVGQKGKRIRPMLVLLAAKMCGPTTERSYRGAALVELLHSATLVHDDVVDEAETRRGVFSINALWKNKIAVLFGDFLLSRGLLLALDHRDYDLLHTLSNAIRRMSEGELLQIEKARRLDIDEATYFQIISDKTASLIAACTRCGALSVTDDEHAVERMGTMGEKLGLAFQIRDDLFDFGLEDVGKPLGIDLKEKKMTLPLIHALQQAERSDRRRIMKIVRKRTKRRADVREVATFVHELGGIAYAEQRMHALADEARAILETFPQNEARDALIGLVQYTIRRKR